MIFQLSTCVAKEKLDAFSSTSHFLANSQTLIIGNSIRAFSQFALPKSFMQKAYNLYPNNEMALLNSFKKIIADRKDLKLITAQYRKALNDSGFVHIKNFDICTSNVEEMKVHLLFLATVIGDPTSHTNNNANFLWDIKTDNQASKNFSRTNLPIPLHTDSQFKLKPEKYFLLYTLKSSKQGDGQTTLVKLSDVVKKLMMTNEGIDNFNFLSTENYPSLVPDIFSSSQEINFSKIFENNSIRFRKDTIEAAMIRLSYGKKKHFQALNFLSNLISQGDIVKFMYLNTGDILLVNNCNCLHGRTGFEDPNRHLLRIRFN